MAHTSMTGNWGFPNGGVGLPWPSAGTIGCDFVTCGIPMWNPFTLQVGLSGGWTWPSGVTVSFFFGLAWDSKGNVAVYHGGGLGVGAGIRGSLGAQVEVSNAATNCGLAGPFGNVSGTGGVGGAAGTVDVFQGRGNGPGGTVTGGGGTFGIGGGVSASGTITATTVTPIAGSAPCP